MARTVWKFPVPFRTLQQIKVPSGATILHVGIDPASGDVAFWAEVEMQARLETRAFQVFGTGYVLSGGDKHVGSVIDGAFVWHLYEYAA